MTISVETLIEVELPSEDDFLKIRETLTRIGVASRKEKKLYQLHRTLQRIVWFRRQTNGF